MAERGIVRIILSGSSHSEHETDTEIEMKTRINSNRSRRSNSENRYTVWSPFISNVFALRRTCTST